MTPCFNAASTLRACIESVATQTYPKLEHLVVDGASTDGTVDLLRSCGSRVAWVSEPDEGQSDAINKGMAGAAGDVLTWLNADDLLEPDAVEVAVERLMTVEEDRVVVYRDLRVQEPARAWTWCPSPRITSAALACGDFIPQPGSFFTRAAWAAVGGLATDLHLALDFDLWLRMYSNGTVFDYRPGVGATFVVTDASKTGSRGRDAFISEESVALQRAGMSEAARIARGRAAFHRRESRRRLAGRSERAGHALEGLRDARERSRGVLRAAVAPSLWTEPLTRSHLTSRIAPRR